MPIKATHSQLRRLTANIARGQKEPPSNVEIIRQEFRNLFKRLTGREPTSEEMNSTWYKRANRILTIIFLPRMKGEK